MLLTVHPWAADSEVVLRMGMFEQPPVDTEIDVKSCRAVHAGLPISGRGKCSLFRTSGVSRRVFAAVLALVGYLVIQFLIYHIHVLVPYAFLWAYLELGNGITSP